MKEAVVGVEYGQIVDYAVEKLKYPKIVFLLLDLDQELTLGPTPKRSSIGYLKEAEKCEIIQIKSLKILFVYVAKLLLDQLNPEIDSPLIVLWGLLSSYGTSPNIELVLSKLLKLKHILIAENSHDYDDILKRWTTISSML